MHALRILLFLFSVRLTLALCSVNRALNASLENSNARFMQIIITTELLLDHTYKIEGMGYRSYLL